MKKIVTSAFLVSIMAVTGCNSPVQPSPCNTPAPSVTPSNNTPAPPTTGPPPTSSAPTNAPSTPVPSDPEVPAGG